MNKFLIEDWAPKEEQLESKAQKKKGKRTIGVVDSNSEKSDE